MHPSPQLKVSLRVYPLRVLKIKVLTHSPPVTPPPPPQKRGKKGKRSKKPTGLSLRNYPYLPPPPFPLDFQAPKRRGVHIINGMAHFLNDLLNYEWIFFVIAVALCSKISALIFIVMIERSGAINDQFV